MGEAGELIDEGVTLRDLREEVHSRTHRAGYTTRSGRPIPPRIQILNNWGRDRLNVWPRGPDGELMP